MKYWLMKSEPDVWSIDQQKKVGEDGSIWDGVRNYQARNLLRDEIKIGDNVLFYHSNSKPSEVVGTATVVSDGYADFTAWDPNSKHPDLKSTLENPIWFMVDIKAVLTFEVPVSLQRIKKIPELSDMVLVKNSRLSVQPVKKQEFDLVVKMGMGEI